MQKIMVAICDDSKEIRDITKKYLEEYRISHNVEFNISEFESGEDLKKGWNSDNQILFLDIDLPKADGIEAAESLIATYDMSGCRIIMLSGLPERFQETYHIKAVDFVTKPIDKKRFFYSLDYVVRDIDPGRQINILMDGQKTVVSEKEIQYIECRGNICYFHTKHGTGSSYITISECENLVSEKYFYKCHRSYLVNLYYVKKIDGSVVLLKNDLSIPVSRLRRKDFAKAISDYRFKQ